MRAIVTVRDASHAPRHPGQAQGPAHAPEETNLVIDADASTPLGDVLDAIRSRVPGLSLTAGHDPELTFANSGLMDGAVIGGPHTVHPDEVGSVQLRWVAGPGSGRVRRITVGETLVGIAADGSAAIGDDILGQPVCAVVVAFDARVTVRALTDDARLVLEAEPVHDEVAEWPPFAQLHIGTSTITAQAAVFPDAELQPSPDAGWLDYNRPPRLLPPVPVSTFRLPAEPQPPNRNALPWITAMIPAALGVAMAVFLKQPFYLLFGLMSPVMMLGSHFSSRKNGKVSHRRMLLAHKETLASITLGIAEAVAAEQHSRRVGVPDAAELRLVAGTPTRRLWERRPTDPDHLLVRVGLADLPSAVQIDDARELEHRRHSTGTTVNVPVTLSIADIGVIGIAGHENSARNVARWILGQLSVLQSPRDLQVYLLAAASDAPAWNWAHWLPHLRPALGQDTVSLTGMDTDSLGRRVAELTQLVTERVAAEGAPGSRKVIHTPDLLVVLDGARRLRAMPGIVALLRDGPAVGVHILCLDEEERQLPEECMAVVTVTGDATLTVRRQQSNDIEEVQTDLVTDTWFDEIARSLAPIRDVSLSDADSLLPRSARLLDVLGLADPTGAAISERWARDGCSTEAVIGLSLDGPFAVDLVRDGPHGLVAGTTGAGKSEFLQTLVASLAVANRPDAMTFVLVDYKGGAAFSGCVDLPHTVGMVTDLDSHLVERALGSLRAELVRREQLLALAGAKDLEDYLAFLGRGGIGEGLPRLTIVIDEFAAMAKELPDFVAGLVGIAQRGRSLGVHLIMATQRPSGVISPEIRANTNLRIALRMTDAGESSDVIDIADASRIPKSIPGRAYARLGHASIIPFQTARVGGTSTVVVDSAPVRKPFVQTLPYSQFSQPAPQPPRAATTTSAVTDLSVLVAGIRAASDSLGIPRQHSPWLAPLAQTIDLDDLDPTRIAWGREDLPARQAQEDAVIDLDVFSHLYVVGAPGSGRSQTLRTIAASIASTSSLSDAHLYGIDCGNGALASLAALPHCGAVTQRNQTERSARLIDRIQAEVLRRHELLGAGNHANIAEQRRSGENPLPHIVLLIDRWDNFMSTLGELDGGRLLEAVQALLRDGASAGVHLVISGDRTLLTSRMAVLAEDKLVLRLTDRLDYSLADLNYKTIPPELPAGRGFRAGSGIEVQVALLGADPSGRGQNEAISRLGGTLTVREASATPAMRPFRVDDLPSSFSLESAFALADRDEHHPPMWAMIGVGGDELVAHGIDFERDSATFVVAGPARSGRSTLLAVMARSLLRGGSELVLVCPRSSPLRELADAPGVRAMVTSADLTEEDIRPHLEPDGTPVVLIIDDGEMVMDSPAKLWLRTYIRSAGDNRRALILGGNSAEICAGFAGWQVDVKKNRRGALLSPQNTVDGDLLGVRVARSMVSARVSPGRALAHLGTGDLLTLQIPEAPAAPTAAPLEPTVAPLP